MQRTLKNMALTAVFGLALSPMSDLNLNFCPRAYATPIISVNPFAVSDPYGLSPFWKWKTIESEHFLVTFPEELTEVANKATHYLEEANTFLSPVLQWQPDHKPQILVIDNQDSANGLTTPLARFGIILWATPPDSNSNTNAYDNWLRLLVIHEYTHYLNMDTTYGLWKILRPVFGAALLPNAAWPPWMLEGLAVYMETQFTTSGRGRSTYYEMVLRAAVEKNVLNTPEFITLDKINGTNPYFPGGDTRYEFGYFLMNEIARSSLAGPTQDGESKTEGGVATLGEMSRRSGERIPLFINGNLENITGKNWYDTWRDWVQSTQKREDKSLAIIHSQPVSSLSLITQPNHTVSNDAEGAAVSLDGKWLAYNSTSADRRAGFYLKDLQRGDTRCIGDKLGGMGMSFAPLLAGQKAPALIYSELNRTQTYNLYSDLKVYDLNTESITPLTEGLRARDPDVSRDGQWVAFTVAESSSTELVRARLLYDGKFKLGPLEKLFIPPQLDRVANPKFSADGRKIFFTLHPNGKFQEDLMELDLSSPEGAPANKPKALVADGNFNIFPAVNKKGDLYFVSNRTGVDNLYLYSGPTDNQLVTNVTTGLWLPSFNLSNDLPEVYASIFSYSGWDIALVHLNLPQADSSEIKYSPEKLKIPAPPIPPLISQAQPHAANKTYPVSNYQFGNTMLPRVWTPLIEYSAAAGLGFGAEVVGFDATNQHRYIAGVSYTPDTQFPDFFALYSNRTTAITFNLYADFLTTSVQSGGGLTIAGRQADLSASAAYPILWTYSSLTPIVSYNYQKDFMNEVAPNPSLIAATPVYQSIDGQLIFSNQETSNLSITSEAGRYIQAGARLYLLPDVEVVKGLWVQQEYFQLWNHIVLAPSVKASVVSSTPSAYFSASHAVLAGRLPQISNVFLADSFNQLSIRGYPGYSYLGKAALVTALDLNFPLFRIFRGLGTNPLFFDNLYGFLFAESSYLTGVAGSTASSSITLPSIGGGIQLSTEAFTVPLVFSTEYHQGLNTEYKGVPDLFFQVAGSLPF